MFNPIKSDTTVTVVDSIMGSGKTSWAIQFMNETPEVQKFIYVTPYLSEVERIKENVVNRKFVTPDPKYGKGKKYEHLKKLVGEGKDIVMTHSLFSYADEELLQLLEWNNYILIMDEVFDVVEQVQITQDDLKLLLRNNIISVNEDGNVRWLDDEIKETRYKDIKQMAEVGTLYLVNDSAFIWLFPVNIFRAFEKAFILTYLFEGQLQRYYYDFYNVKYDYKSVLYENSSYKLCHYDKSIERRDYFKGLITICEDLKLNSIGEKKTALSKSWFTSSNNATKVKQLKDNLYNYFQHKTKAKSEEILWTSFKCCKEKLKGKGYSSGVKDVDYNNTVITNKNRCYTPFNLRATNMYRYKTVLAFCINRYMNPIQKHFFQHKNIEVNEDLLALSDLLQWIYRSAIRDGKEVQIYIPSLRMRTLLTKWLDNEI
ncbi:DEAD/DEAH box helicase family protein [Clostridium manihotivorum]|uniref:Uncharacterized protein n=1 Tax=Clostridium manihotivorum TaxID=2320868 RepID=A0A3R5VAJ1_9CLOT|nr:DEAD/DEAH box helicase family protein [Clostridium manihotivorum]QAA33950.1 hypothetical protein C1I91_21255 [Clostridium manihotivorum]